ncbi:MAG: aldehyde ferredoxin oxidoreductase N-terminal domain-containing protein, partial [Candidatus Bathyarchaeia archaeon]
MLKLVGGYVQKILYVNLTTGRIDEKPLGIEKARNFLGGKGLAARILYDEIKPGIDPLNPDNVIMFATGPLTGLPIPGAVKVIVATKSPLTGTWCDSAASGFWGPQLKFAGYDAVIFKGKSENPVYVWINDEKIEIRSAERLWGKNTHETDKEIKKELGDEHVSVAAIGPAGEQLVRYANVSIDLWRHAGRGGTGAVMGSKNLKAVVVKGRQKVPVEDKEALKKLSKDLVAIVKKQINRWGVKHNIPEEGTNENLDVEIETGVTPYRNYQTITPVHMQEDL